MTIPKWYRGYRINTTDMRSCYAHVRGVNLWAASWPELRDKIDAKLPEPPVHDAKADAAMAGLARLLLTEDEKRLFDRRVR